MIGLIEVVAPPPVNQFRVRDRVWVFRSDGEWDPGIVVDVWPYSRKCSVETFRGTYRYGEDVLAFR